MSVWSRSHADLALLVKTMQARNISTRQKLDNNRGMRNEIGQVGVSTERAVSSSHERQVEVSSPGSHTADDADGSTTNCVAEGHYSTVSSFGERPDSQGKHHEYPVSVPGFAGRCHTLDTVGEVDELVILHDPPVGQLRDAITFHEEDKIISQENINFENLKKDDINYEKNGLLTEHKEVKILSHVGYELSTHQEESEKQIGMQITTHDVHKLAYSREKEMVNSSLISCSEYADLSFKGHELEESPDANSESHQLSKDPTTDSCTLSQNLVCSESLASKFQFSRKEFYECVSQCVDKKLNVVCSKGFISGKWTPDSEVGVQGQYRQDVCHSQCDEQSYNQVNFNKEINVLKGEDHRIYSVDDLSEISDATDNFTNVNYQHHFADYGVGHVSDFFGELLSVVSNESSFLDSTTKFQNVNNLQEPTASDNNNSQGGDNGEMSEQSPCSLLITTCDAGCPVDIASTLSISPSLTRVLTEENQNIQSESGLSGTVSCHTDMSCCIDVVNSDHNKQRQETPLVETPLVETPLVETPLVETPLVETPAVCNTSWSVFDHGDRLNAILNISEIDVNKLTIVVTKPLHSACRTYQCESFTEAESLENNTCDLKTAPSLNVIPGCRESSNNDTFWHDVYFTPHPHGQPCETFLTFSTSLRVSSRVEQKDQDKITSLKGSTICPIELPRSFIRSTRSYLFSEASDLETSQNYLPPCAHVISELSKDGQSKFTVSEMKPTSTFVGMSSHDFSVGNLDEFDIENNCTDVSLYSLVSTSLDKSESVGRKEFADFSLDTGHANTNDVSDSFPSMSLADCHNMTASLRVASKLESSGMCEENIDCRHVLVSVANTDCRHVLTSVANTDCHHVLTSASILVASKLEPSGMCEENIDCRHVLVSVANTDCRHVLTSVANADCHRVLTSVIKCDNERTCEKSESYRECFQKTSCDLDKTCHDSNNNRKKWFKPHNDDTPKSVSLNMVNVNDLCSYKHCDGAVAHSDGAVAHSGGAVVPASTNFSETDIFPAEVSYSTATNPVFSELQTQLRNAEDSDLGHSSYNELGENRKYSSASPSHKYPLLSDVSFESKVIAEYHTNTETVSPKSQNLKYSRDDESILVKANSHPSHTLFELRETCGSSETKVYPADESSEPSSSSSPIRNSCLSSDEKFFEKKPPETLYDRQELCGFTKDVPIYVLLEGGCNGENDNLVVNESSRSKKFTDVASMRMLELLTTLRILRDKLKQGQSVTQCALLLRRLESSKQFFTFNRTPALVSIRNDLKQVCQTLTRRIEASKETSALIKTAMNRMPSGRKSSTKQHERDASNTHCLKPKSYEIKSVAHNKTRRLQADSTKLKKLHSYKRPVKSEAVLSEDDSHIDVLKHAAADRLKPKHNTDIVRVPSCNAPLDSDHLQLSDSSESAAITVSSSTLIEDRGSADMENESELGFQLDREFDKYLADMKPHVLKSPQKTERQKSAVWIKKLCEPVKGGVTARKTRNMYAHLLLEMLKKGALDNPFDQKPESGALKPLPSYLTDRLPDWVEGELVDTVGSSLFTKSLGVPAATSTWVSSTAEFLERPHSSMGHTLEKDPSLSPIRHTTDFSHPRYSADDMSIELQRSPTTSRRHRKVHHLPSGDREKRLLPDVNIKESRENDKLKEVTIHDADWTKPYSSTISSTYSLPKGTTFYEDPNFLKPADRELAMRAKMIEAKFHEEKLKLQQKHDAAVQKILDRKNAEIEDLKILYKTKIKDMEDTINKLERKVQTLLKETEFIRQSKDKQIAELKNIAEESNESRKSDYEKKLHELITEFEQEKFELQKQHTQNIQEILDDTNDRLQRMESEYTNQTNITTDVIKDLESRVQQLMNEVDTSLSQRSAVEKEKNEVWLKYEKICSENERLRERLALQEREQQKIIEAHEHEMRSLNNKTEASLEYLKQEHSMANSKAADTIRDLEEKIDLLKKSLKENEEHRLRQIREMEQNHQQDKIHTENLHDKQVRNLKKELEQLDAVWNKKVDKLEQIVKDKEQAMNKLKEQKHQQKLQAEQALEDFKSEVEKNQNKIYEEMKQQMQHVEIDLQKSKQSREKQAKEFAKQLENERYSHQHELAELKMTYEADKSHLIREFQIQKEFLLNEHERDVENLKDLHRTEILSLEARMKEKQNKAEKSATDNERMIRELREELLQANQLRKEQLVELGLLRDEERQKMHRDHEAELARVRAEMEQQRLGLQKAHSAEIENVLEKTNQRLSTLEKDFTNRAAKSSETITELQTVIKQLREENQRCKESCEKQISDLKHSQEEEKRSLKKKFSHNIEALRSEVDSQKNRGNNAERRLQKAESDLEERLTELKIHYEEKIRGLVPLDVKKELEETIVALKSQVNSLQLRSALLQEELDSRSGLSSFGALTNTVIKSAV